MTSAGLLWKRPADWLKFPDLDREKIQGAPGLVRDKEMSIAIS